MAIYSLRNAGIALVGRGNRQNVAKVDVTEIVTVVERNAHDTVAKLKGPIDMVVIDADKQGYADHLKRVLLLLVHSD